MIDLPRPRVMPDVLKEHLEDLDFLWSQREAVLFRPDWRPAELAALEERADAHLDALHLAGASGVELVRPHARGSDPGLAAAAALVMMSAAHPELAAEVVVALAEEGAPAEGARVGLRHSDVRLAVGPLRELAERGAPLARARACDVLAFHRLPAPPVLASLLASEDPEILRLACGAAGRFGRPWDPALLDRALAGGDRELRRAAFEASARLGAPPLSAAVRAAATRAEPAPDALRWLGVLGDRADLPLLLRALDRPELADAAIAALGALGDPAAIPALLGCMDDARTAPAAAAAFTRITGAPALHAAASSTAPENVPEDERDFRDDSPPPDPLRARDWWKAEAPRFTPAGRWQDGRDATAAERRPGLLDELPLEARRDLYLSTRARQAGAFPGLEIEARVRLAFSRSAR